MNLRPVDQLLPHLTALLYQPCISFMSEWFVRKRGLANGVISAGMLTGGSLKPFQPKVKGHFLINLRHRSWGSYIASPITAPHWFIRASQDCSDSLLAAFGNYTTYHALSPSPIT